MVDATIGASQNALSRNRSSTASAFDPTLDSTAHQSSSGMWMSPASSDRAASLATIASASFAGNRRAEQASWLRTWTSGSVAARSMIFRASLGDGSPSSQASRTVQSRTWGSAWSSASRAVASSSPPTRFNAQSASRASCPVFSASRRFISGAIEASLRSPISRSAVCRVHRLGSFRRSASSLVVSFAMSGKLRRGSE